MQKSALHDISQQDMSSRLFSNISYFSANEIILSQNQFAILVTYLTKLFFFQFLFKLFTTAQT